MGWDATRRDPRIGARSIVNVVVFVESRFLSRLGYVVHVEGVGSG